MARDRDERDDDDVEEDRPRRRRRRDEDDDDREPRPKKKSNAMLIIGIIMGVLFLLSVPCVAVLIGLLLPAVQKVREAASRSQDQNNMKQLALATHNYESSDANGEMAGPFHKEDGVVNRGLSWRASLLPYIEQDNVYRMLDRKAAWDSPANRAATSLRIQTYKSVWDQQDQSNNTPYLAFVGGGALFDDAPNAKPTRLSAISDGTSNTILYVHAANQVPWAAPQDIRYSPTAPLPKFGHPNGPRNGFNVCMADGSVRFVASPVDEVTFRAMITRAGGEPIFP